MNVLTSVRLKQSVIPAIILALTLMAGSVTADNDDPCNERHQLQYTGPVETTTLAKLAEQSGLFTGDIDAILEGQLVRQLPGGKFVFKDSTGELQIELDDEVCLSQPIDATTKVRLFGEYERGNPPEFDVKRLQVL